MMVSAILAGVALAAASTDAPRGAVRAEVRATIVRGVSIGALHAAERPNPGGTAVILPTPRTRTCSSGVGPDDPSCRLIVYDMP